MKIFKRVFLTLLGSAVVFGLWYMYQNALPIIAGYGAKSICSCVMVAGRDPQNVIDNEVGKFPFSLGWYSVDYSDSSATGTVMGLAKQKAIYRKGLGCTLIAEITEEELRAQYIKLPSHPTIDQDTIPWPSGDLTTDSLPKGVDYETLRKVVHDAFDEGTESKLRRTRAIVIAYDGKIIAETYAQGFNSKSKQIGWSMTKSITNAMVGILVKEGKLDVTKSAPIASWANDNRNTITLNDLMQQSSGLLWNENYSTPSSVTNMLFRKKNMGLYAAESPLQGIPGEKFYYSSGTSNIISRVVRSTAGDENYYKLPYEKLFYKIGMYSALLEPDAGGTFVGSSYCFATARDWVRFGLLYLNDGVWNDERILPVGWVTYTTTPARGAPIGEYGAQFWLNAGEKGNPAERRYPDAPVDLFIADGFEGQNVWVVPSKKLVIARLSLQQGNYLNANRFLADVISTLP